MELGFRVVWLVLFLLLVLCACGIVVRGKFDRSNRRYYFRIFTIYVVLINSFLLIGMALEVWNRQITVAENIGSNSATQFANTLESMNSIAQSYLNLEGERLAEITVARDRFEEMVGLLRLRSEEYLQLQQAEVKAHRKLENLLQQLVDRKVPENCEPTVGNNPPEVDSLDPCLLLQLFEMEFWSPVVAELVFRNEQPTRERVVVNPSDPQSSVMQNLIGLLTQGSSGRLIPHALMDTAQKYVDSDHRITLLFRTPSFPLGQPSIDCSCETEICNKPLLLGKGNIQEGLEWAEQKANNNELVSLVVVGRHDAIPFYGGSNSELATRRARCVAELLSLPDVNIEYVGVGNRYDWSSSSDSRMRDDRSVEVYAIYRVRMEKRDR